MALLSFRIPSLLARISTMVAIAAIAGAGCNFQSSSSSEGRESDTGDGYAANQDALEGEGESAGPIQPEEMAGCDGSTWYVCFTPTLTVKWPSPPGEVTYSAKPGTIPCVPVSTKGGVIPGDSSGTIEIAIDGTAENDSFSCTIRGATSVTFDVTAQCVGSEARGNMLLSILQQWGMASATLSCAPKREGVNVIPETIIELGTLGEQTDKMELLLQNEPVSDCETRSMAGPLTGSLVYCLFPYGRIQPVPLVEPPKPGW